MSSTAVRERLARGESVRDVVPPAVARRGSYIAKGAILMPSYVNIGAFTNNDAMYARVSSAAKAEGEKMWHMPLDEDYKDLLKSQAADLANIGGRWGGAISAAWFLREFVGETPWVHLDIAGTAWLEEPKPYIAKGPSGVAVRTFVRLATSWVA